MYGHVEKLAQEIKKGAESIECVEAKLWQVCKSIIRTYKVSIILLKKQSVIFLNKVGQAVLKNLLVRPLL
jgi:hypothetical protein